ncbi:LPS-assembly protein LptD [Marichromatium bheemlicum]|uniref:LPS-assembly protein LptD n=1 Tax=Marichromatium bheemlicum TaxID=365339 RepID=A0ABX1I758_9GAMM|nr:LPS-assembly protein LptD [Marichromatium bheemlicum]NKN32879.1 LPS-assembly protein LptD [Marichromatium bheemlicum]
MATMVDFKQGVRASLLATLLAVSAPGSANCTQDCPEPESSDGGAFATLRAMLSAIRLPDLVALTPLAPDDSLPVEPEEPAPEAGSVRASEDYLHQGLAWDHCGPRSGAGASNLGAENADIPVDIVADRVDYDRSGERIELRGTVEISRPGQRLEADRATYDRASGQTNASGSVFIDYRGLRIQGDRADYNLDTQAGEIERARYRLSGSANLRGSATHATLLDPARSRYEDIVYTTCAPGNRDWSIRASSLELDRDSGIGVARNARLRVADVPVLYTPYLRFPIDDRRRSGLLIPLFGSSSETGTDITLPYYWNIAPNMDATLMPRYMSTRGLMLGGEFRYLSARQQFEVNAELLPEDRKNPEEGVRGALRLRQHGYYNGWASSIDYASVSDDQYLSDFGNRLDATSLRNLSQRADFSYAGDGWQTLVRLQQFQTVDTSIAPEDRPYGQLPHIALNLDPQRAGNLFEYRFQGQYDYFDHNTAVHGSRLIAIPSARIPLRRSFGHLIPQARVYYTGYELQDQQHGLPERPSHLIPSFDLDGKLVFERETNWFGNTALQTLEPRLYYVLTGYEDQSDTPRFDTTALDFSFASLFRPNRFTGYDRIGDENRLTLGLTSRTIADDSGRELFRASVGQIYYFDSRRVQLDGGEAEDDISSSVAGEFAARLSHDWSARASVQWNPNETEDAWEKRVLQLRYAPEPNRLVNLSYRYNLGNQSGSERYEDADLSFQLPLGDHTRLVGRWLYSMLNDETVEAFAGIEYGRCCWRLRLLGQHLKTSYERDGSTSVMLQLELAGLGSFGNPIDKLLERGIYGYHTD